MDPFTLIDGDRVVELPARIDGERVRLDAAALETALGWSVHDGLLCRDAVCIPLAEEAALASDGGVDLAGFARALERSLAVDVAERAAFLGGSARERAQALASQQAPDFTLPDLDGRLYSLNEQRGKKVLLVAWASW
jgi:AhpC/TSA family protein